MHWLHFRKLNKIRWKQNDSVNSIVEFSLLFTLKCTKNIVSKIYFSQTNNWNSNKTLTNSCFFAICLQTSFGNGIKITFAVTTKIKPIPEKLSKREKIARKITDCKVWCEWTAKIWIFLAKIEFFFSSFSCGACWKLLVKLRTSPTMKPSERATDTETESLMKVSLDLLSVSTVDC